MLLCNCYCTETQGEKEMGFDVLANDHDLKLVCRKQTLKCSPVETNSVLYACLIHQQTQALIFLLCFQSTGIMVMHVSTV
jgi:hypothetical protein